MNVIKPSITLFTRESDDNLGLHIVSLIMKHNGNNYHLYASTTDTLYVFQETIALYVLTTNKINGTLGLYAYISPEPFPLNRFNLYTREDIVGVFGVKWEQLPAETILLKLINYLI